MDSTDLGLVSESSVPAKPVAGADVATIVRVTAVAAMADMVEAMVDTPIAVAVDPAATTAADWVMAADLVLALVDNHDGAVTAVAEPIADAALAATADAAATVVDMVEATAVVCSADVEDCLAADLPLARPESVVVHLAVALVAISATTAVIPMVA